VQLEDNDNEDCSLSTILQQKEDNDINIFKVLKKKQFDDYLEENRLSLTTNCRRIIIKKTYLFIMLFSLMLLSSGLRKFDEE
jgi:hypothetical protein